MKKLLLSAVAVLGLLPGLTSTVSAELVAEDRSGWVISGCSNETGEGAGLGTLDAMKDGILSTFWHSVWSASSHRAQNHYFVVDRGEALAETALSAVGYTPRQDGSSGNGYVTACDVYILDSVDGLNLWSDSSNAGLCDGGHNIDTFISENALTPTAQGTFSYSYGDTSNRGESTVTFAPTAGRYILFVATATSGSQGDYFANCAEFNAYTSNVPLYPVTLTINYGNGQSIVVDYGLVEEGTTYTKPAFDSSVLTVTGWTDGDQVTAAVNMTGTLAEGVKPFKLNSLRYSGKWATTDANGLLIPDGTFDTAEFFFEVPVEGSTNFTIYSLNQLKWLGAINGNIAKIPFADVAGEYQLIKHTSGAEAIGNAGAASTDIAFLNYRNPGIGSWSAGNDAGSHWFMVYDNTNYQANLTAMGVQVGGTYGDIEGSTYATKIAEAEAKYAAVADIADDVVPGFGVQKAALSDAIDAAKAARAGVSGVDIAALLETLTAANEVVNANIVNYGKGLNLINNGNAFAALGIASEEGLAAWQTVVETAEAMDPSAITESDIENLVTAYGELVATSANTPGGAYITLACYKIPTDLMCVRYGNGPFVGRYGDDVNGNKTTWQVVAAEGGFKLYNEFSAKYLKMPAADNTNMGLTNEADASVFVLDLYNSETAQYGVKYIGNDAHESHIYLHTNNGNTIVRWEAGNNSSWYLAASDAETAAVEATTGAADDIEDALYYNEFSEEYIGEGVGKYTLSEDYAAALAAAKAITAESSNEEKHSAADALRATYATGATINAPEAGKFYRFKNKYSNKYITSIVNDANDLTLVDENANPAETIFYFDGTCVVAWADGKVLGNYNSGESELSWKTVLKGATNEGEITFPGSSILGCYYIQTQLDRRLYGGADTGRGDAVDCAGLTSGDKYSWILTEVTELPIAYNEGFVWSTLYSPVQLGLIENKVEAYVGTLNAEDPENVTLVVTELKGSIPANTGVILGVVKSDDIVVDGYVYLPIEDNTADEVASALVGSSYTVAQEEVATAAEEGVYNFLFQEDSVTDTETDEVSNFGKFNLDMVSDLVGFTAYVTASSIDSDEVITIADSEGNNPTGIEEIAVESEKVQGIYDLQGRRLSAPVKGINIINGKKVLVK